MADNDDRILKKLKIRNKAGSWIEVNGLWRSDIDSALDYADNIRSAAESKAQSMIDSLSTDFKSTSDYNESVFSSVEKSTSLATSEAYSQAQSAIDSRSADFAKKWGSFSSLQDGYRASMKQEASLKQKEISQSMSKVVSEMISERLSTSESLSQVTSELKSTRESLVAEGKSLADEDSKNMASLSLYKSQWGSEQASQSVYTSEQLKSLNNDLTSARNSLVSDAQNKSQSLAKIYDSLASAEQSLKTVASGMTSLSNGVKSTTDSLTAGYRDQSGKMTSLTANVDGLQATMTDASGKINSLSTGADGMSQAISKANGDIQTVKKTADGNAASIKSAQGDIANLQTTASDLQADLANANKDIANVQATAKGLQANVTDAQSDINSLSLGAKGMSQSISDNAGNIQSVKKTAEGNVTAIKSAQDDITNLQTNAKGMQATLATAQSNINSLSLGASGMSASISTAQGDINNLKTTASGNSSAIKNAQGDINTLQADADGLKQEVAKKVDNTTYQTGISNLNNQIDLKANKSYVDGELSKKANSAELSVTNEQVKAQASRISSVTTTINGVSGVANNALSKANNANDKIDNLSIGGRNYIQNSKSMVMIPIGKDNYDLSWNVYQDEFFGNSHCHEYLKTRLGFDLRPSKALTAPKTFNIYWRATPWTFFGTITVPANTTDKQHYELAITTPATQNPTNQIFMRFMASDTDEVKYTITNSMLTIGDTFPDWSPAPEDVEGKITDLQNKTTPQQLIKTVTDSGQANHVVTADSVNQSITGVRTEITKAKDELTGKLTTVNSKVTENTNNIKSTKDKTEQLISSLGADSNGNFTWANNSKIDSALGSYQTISKIDSKIEVVQGIADNATSLANTAQDTADSATSLAQTAQNTANNVQNNLTSYKAEVSTTYAKASTTYTKSDVDGIAKSVKEQTADSIKSEISRVSIGGRNLLKGTADVTGDVSEGSRTEVVRGIFRKVDAVKCNIAWLGQLINMRSALSDSGVQVGDYLTLSVYVKADKKITTGDLRVYRFGGSVSDAQSGVNTGYIPGNIIRMSDRPITPEWQQFSFTGRVEEGTFYRENTRIEYNQDTGDNYIYMAGWQLEKGSKATDWSPAPEDMAYKSQMLQKPDGWSAVLSDNYGRILSGLVLDNSDVRFKGNHIHLDGQTIIDNSIIKSAMIDSLDATKIKTGSLSGDRLKGTVIDGNIANIKNVNVSTLTGGYIDASHIRITGSSQIANAVIGTAQIADGAITSAKIGSLDAGKITVGTLKGIDIQGVNVSGSTFLSTNMDSIPTGGAVVSSTSVAPGEIPKPALLGGNVKHETSIGSGIVSLGNFRNTQRLTMDVSAGAVFIDERDTGYVNQNIITTNTSGGLMWKNNHDFQIDTGITSQIGSDKYYGVHFKHKNDIITVGPGGIISWAENNKNDLRLRATSNVGLQGDIIFFDSADTKTRTFEYGGDNNGRYLNLNTSGNLQVRGMSGFIVNSDSNFGGHWVGMGSLSVSGSKNSSVQTSKGWTLINAYETAEYYFGDLGIANTGDGCKTKITLDPLFKETINLKERYHAFVSPYGNAKVWVSKKTENYFVVQSDTPNIEFSWEIKAKRLGYENRRLELDDDMERQKGSRNDGNQDGASNAKVAS